ncbi:PAS domain-containing protein [bacterium]|nr:PAS domain-containing protein [bacterium]MBU4123701.1 PAS domain-containing protein [bacterium]
MNFGNFKLSNLSIKQRLFFSFGAVILLMVIISGIDIQRFSDRNKRFNILIDRVLPRQLLATQIQNDLLKIHRAEKNFIAELKSDEMDKDKANINKYESDLLKQLETLDALVSAQGKKDIAAFREIYDKWQIKNEEIRRLSRMGANIKARDLSSEEGRVLFDRMDEIMTRIIERKKLAMIRQRQLVNKNYIITRNSLIFITGIIILMTYLLSISVAKSILTPLGKLEKAARIIGKGRLDTKITIRGKDEISQLVESFNKMSEDLNAVTVSRDKLNKEITEHRRTSRQLQLQTEKVLRAQRVAQMGFLEWNTKTDGIYWSEEVYRIYGVDPDKQSASLELTMQLVHPEDMEFVKKNLDMAVKGIGQYDIEHRIRRPDGAVIWVHAQADFERDENGNGEILLGTIVDITKRKKAEDERANLQNKLLQSQKMEAIGQFVGGIAHDFNNLLTPILALSDLSIYSISDEKALLSNLKEIKTASVRGRDLIAQLLAFGRKQILRPEVLNLNDLVGNISKMLIRIIGEDVELNIHLADKLGNIRIDPVQAEQIIMNLTINAKAAMPKGGELTFETANVTLDVNYIKNHINVTPGSYIMLAISDSGSGMEKETVDHIFEPFFTTKGDMGSGLGLSTVYGIVKQSGGDIRVYSEPGHGTTFKIYFPRIYAKAEMIVKEQISKKSLKGTETILVVEDENMVREAIRQILEWFGYKPLLAATGPEAERHIKNYKDKIHMLITDVILPGKLNGKEIAEQITRERPDIKTLFISGYTENAIVEKGILKTNINFLQKPFDPATLSKKIREILDAPENPDDDRTD